MEPFTDYYAELGVETDAPASVIKAKFKHLALQYHPDVYKGKDAEVRMRALLLAYQTLNSPESRKAYDEQHARHFTGVPAEHNRVYVGSTVNSSDGKPHKRTEISPTARRDRQRHYAFPHLDNGQPAHFTLGEIAYDLSVDEARILKEQGMLRGVETVRKGQQHLCHRCHHRWTPEEGKAGGVLRVRSCPSCNALDWAEYLLLRCTHCTAVFESEQIRYNVGSIHYGNEDADLCPPYELFPLCPYCAASGWCPAENARVQILRKQAERKAAILRAIWFTLAVVVIIAVGAVIVSVAK